jgi:hypothetical protein
MASSSHRVYLWSAWAFLASVVLQVFFIGLYLFAGYDLGPHFLGALIVTIVSLVVLVVSFAARLDTRSKQLAGALFVLVIVQGILPNMKDSIPIVAALHPVNALVLFWLGLVILRDAQGYVRADAAVRAESASAEAPAPAR